MHLSRASEMKEGDGAWEGPVSSVRENVAKNLVLPTAESPRVTVWPKP